MANNDSWLSNNFATYLLLEEGASPDKLQEKIPALLEKNAGPQLLQALGITFEEFLAAGNRYGLYLQPLSDIHLNPDIQHSFKPINDKKVGMYVTHEFSVYEKELQDGEELSKQSNGD